MTHEAKIPTPEPRQNRILAALPAVDYERLLPDLELKVVDPDCYDLQRGIVFKERSPEDLIV